MGEPPSPLLILVQFDEASRGRILFLGAIMDKQEASEVLRNALESYRHLTHNHLRAKIGEDRHFEVVARSGIEYQVEIQVFWESAPGGNLLVMGSVDDGGVRAFFPFCETFVVKPAADQSA